MIAAWIAFCVIIAASYAGDLVSFLTTPTYSASINSLKKVLESGLPWEMVLYGEEEEAMMARSTDPVIKKIWQDKDVVEFSPTPKV